MFSTALGYPCRRYQHALSFGSLANQWLESGTSPALIDTNFDLLDDAVVVEDPNSLSAMERQQHPEQWKDQVVISEQGLDVHAFEAYLKTLFSGNAEVEQAFKTLRQALKDFRLPPFDRSSVKITIGHLLAGDGLTPEKQGAFKELQSDSAVIDEWTSVLNMQPDNIKDWSWTVGENSVPHVVRRSLNGKYRVFMDEEMTTGILLQYIGVHWENHLKSSLKTFLTSGAWDTAGTGKIKAFAYSFRPSSRPSEKKRKRF